MREVGDGFCWTFFSLRGFFCHLENRVGERSGTRQDVKRKRRTKGTGKKFFDGIGNLTLFLVSRDGPFCPLGNLYC